MKTRGFCAVSLTGVMIMFLGAGCGSGGSSPAATTAVDRLKEPVVTVAAIPAVDLAGLYIAQDDGLFAQQGLRVTIEKIPSSQSIITDQENGQVDITAGSYVAYIAAQAAGARFRILAEASTLEPGTRALVTTAGSSLTTITGLAGKKIGVNGANSIGILLISTLLAEHGISLRTVHFVTAEQGFPAMPGQLQAGAWDAAFLAEPYITLAAEEYGDRVLADLDQGAALNFPIDGYVATQAWAQRNPRTAAAFVRAIEEGQRIANSNALAVQTAVARYDKLPPRVTAAMEASSYPIGPVAEKHIQRVALSMLQFGLLSGQYAAEVKQGTLAQSMLAAPR
jgi:NitT/TauT family transport system substrate-binding protein